MESAMDQLQKLLTYGVEAPLWVRLGFATSILLYGYIKYSWSGLEELGFDTIAPSIFKFGTAAHYGSANGMKNFAQSELVDKGRKSVAYYRITSPVVLTIDKDIIQQIFTSQFSLFNTRMPTDGTFALGKDLNTTLDQINDIHQWKRVRSTMAPGFSSKQLTEMLPIINGCLDTLIEQLNGLDGAAIDAKVVSGKFAFDAIFQSAMSVDFNKECPDIHEFNNLPAVQHMIKAFNPSGLGLLPTIVPGLANLLDALDIVIYEPKTVKWIGSFTRALIKGRDDDSGRAKDFLNLFAKSKISEEEAKTATKGLTEHEIVGNVFILFAAGFETTATTIMWAMYELARDPELQTMMQEEAREVDATNYGDLTPDKMPLICSMINEVLRVHAPVGVNARRCVQSTTINGHHIKKGTNVEFPVDQLHHLPEYWGNDASEFKATRFMDNPKLEKEIFFMPFGAGPRNCVGMRLALLEIRCALVRLLSNVDISFAPGFVDDVTDERTLIFLNKPSKEIMLKFANLYR